MTGLTHSFAQRITAVTLMILVSVLGLISVLLSSPARAAGSFSMEIQVRDQQNSPLDNTSIIITKCTRATFGNVRFADEICDALQNSSLRAGQNGMATFTVNAPSWTPEEGTRAGPMEFTIDVAVFNDRIVEDRPKAEIRITLNPDRTMTVSPNIIVVAATPKPSPTTTGGGSSPSPTATTPVPSPTQPTMTPPPTTSSPASPDKWWGCEESWFKSLGKGSAWERINKFFGFANFEAFCYTLKFLSWTLGKTACFLLGTFIDPIFNEGGLKTCDPDSTSTGSGSGGGGSGSPAPWVPTGSPSPAPSGSPAPEPSISFPGGGVA